MLRKLLESTRPGRRRHARGGDRLHPVEPLEGRVLLTASPLMPQACGHEADDFFGSTGCREHVYPDGSVAYEFPTAPAWVNAAVSPISAGLQPTPYSLGQTFKLHSLPTATKTIYLDFTGHVTINTGWNFERRNEPIVTPVWSLDGDPAFSDAELRMIQDAWARVAEDFAPFEVNVTTEEPSAADLARQGAGDQRWGVRAVIGEDTWHKEGVGGIAFVGSFSSSDDIPCFVFNSGSAASIALTVSHEVGHTLGLGHHGTNTTPAKVGEYYSGHGSGVTSWGPIMGAPFSASLTQWAKGEYTNASKPYQDDLAIIVGQGNGFGFRRDDHGNSYAAATAMPLVADGRRELTGIIETTFDVDMMSFRVDSRVQTRITVDPFAVGGNLDVSVSLLSATGRVLATAAPPGSLSATIDQLLDPGTYYVSVQNSGFGDPRTDGYSRYGSLGNYTVAVSTPTASTPAPVAMPTISINDVTVVEGSSGSPQAKLTVSLSAASARPVTVRFATSDGSAVAGGDYGMSSGTVTFAAGQTSRTIQVPIVPDRQAEEEESFVVVLSSPTNATLARPIGTVTIRDDDAAPLPAVSIAGGSVVEGNSGLRTLTFTLTLSAKAAQTITVAFGTADGAARGGRDYIATNGMVRFLAGQDTATISIQVIGDRTIEGSEDFDVFLRSANGAALSPTAARATGTILDDDAPPSAMAFQQALLAGSAGPVAAQPPKSRLGRV